MLKKILYILILVQTQIAFSQTKKQGFVTISGTVFDITARQPIEAVVVQSSLGRGALTDSFGKYTITLRTQDSIWFSMLGKSTAKYPVDTIQNLDAFDIMIHMRVTDLPDVKVRSRSYRLDSIANRQEYAKLFNYKKPTLSLLSNRTFSPGGLSVGFDLQEIINIFRFKRNKSLAALQKRLLQQEQDKYIDHRFTKLFVKKLTKLQGNELDSFMNVYRPNYDFLLSVNDIEFGYWIQQNYESYKANKLFQKGSLRKQDEQ